LISWIGAALLAGCVGGATESESPVVSALAPTSGARTWVDRPLAHRRARNTAGGTAHYFGGPVTPNPKVYVVWWGDPSKINPALTAAKGGIADYYAGVLDSNFMDWLNEYNTTVPAQAGSHMGMAGTGQRIGRGNYAGTLTLASVPSGNVTDAQIQSVIDAAFVAGTLPPPDENTIYAIYFPKGVNISLDGLTSCQTFGAYHMNTVETQRHDAVYLVMPDCGSSFAGWTSVSTHELVEALTDNLPTAGSNPNYPQAWNDSMGNEVGDLCEGSDGMVTTALGMFTVQDIWDERTMGCVAFSSDTNDFNVAVSPNVATVAAGATSTFTVKTATSAGAAQMLTLSASAPAGITASVSPTTVSSGATATLTVTMTNPSATSGMQVVVRGDATAGSVVQTHTAAVLLSTTASSVDLGQPPPDLSQAPPDLAHAPADLAHAPADLAHAAADLAHAPPAADLSSSSDLSSSGVGGGGEPPPSGSGGCGCFIGAGANASAATTLLVLALLVVALLRRRRA
jgi:hypothetical protein